MRVRCVGTRARAGCEVQGLIGASPRVHETGVWSCGDPLKTTIAVDGVGLVPLVTNAATSQHGLSPSASGRLWWRKRRRTGELQPPSRRPQLVGATTHLASAPTAPATGRGPRWVSARSWAQSGGRTCSTCSKSNFSARLRLTATAQVRARGAAGADPDSWTRRPSTAQSVFGTFCLVSSSLNVKQFRSSVLIEFRSCA